MKKKLIVICLACFYVFPGFSQDKPNYLTNFYFADTIVEVNHIKIEYKIPMAYGDKFKVQTYFTNLTDSFKIIEPSDIKFINDGNAFNVIGKGPFVIPPHCTRKFRLLAEGTGFKNSTVKTSITGINTTGKIENIYAPKEFILDRDALRATDANIFPTHSVGPLLVKLKSFVYKPNGDVIVKLNVSYTGSAFLGIHAKKIKLIATNGKVFANRNQSASSLYYRKEKKEMTLTLEFENPYGTSKEFKTDKIVFDDVFVEYATDKNTLKYEFTFTKKGEGLGNPPKEEKGKDIEVIED